MKDTTIKSYIYIYSYHEDESSLCSLEMRSFFGKDTHSSILESTVKIDPSRSPFIQERIGLIYEGRTLQDITKQVKDLQLSQSSTFKVVFVKNRDLNKSEQVSFKERREIEREVGLQITGKPDLINPDVLFAVTKVNNRWVFGAYAKNKQVWLNHQNKPNSYSTALSTRVARAVVNIAVPKPKPSGIKVIDPCCGIGTVLVEGLSMGINIVGSDNNPLILPGARENIAYFGFETEVLYRDLLDITENYDATIIDMPYNLCSVITEEKQFKMLQKTREIAKRVVVVTIEDIDKIIEEAGLKVIDRGDVKKGKLTRQIIVCE